MSSFQPIRFGKYVLLNKIATGGMAQLYMGKITGIQGFEKLIAIKMILPHLAQETELVTSFIDEAKLAALLQHPNIVQIYDFGHADDSYFISMEYLLGKDLRTIWKKAKDTDKPMNLEDALYVITRALSGLAYAHELKDFQGNPLSIIHRDVSPQNIFVTYDGDVKILDFGIAKAASQSTVTQHGMIKGKVAYMSPEQAAGRTIDQRSDLFSAGIILYELVTWNRMFRGESTMQILARVREADYEPPEAVVSDLAPTLGRILRKAVIRDPAERYQSCGDMLVDLDEAMIELRLRPSAKALGRYMKDLFAEEIAEEKRLIRELSGTGKSAEETGQIRLEESRTGEISIEPDQPITGSLQTVPDSPELPSPPVSQAPPEPDLPEDPPPPDCGPSTAAWLSDPAPTASSESAEFEPPAEDAEPPPAKRSRKTVSLCITAAIVIVALASGLGFWSKHKSLSATSIDQTADSQGKVDAQPAVNPDELKKLFQLASDHIKKKEYTKAIDIYERIAKADPNFPHIYFHLGFAYGMNKNYAKAEEMYGRTVQLAPDYLDEALFNLALVEEKLGKKKEAIAHLMKAQAINPNNTLIKEALERIKKNMEKNT